MVISPTAGMGRWGILHHAAPPMGNSRFLPLTCRHHLKRTTNRIELHHRPRARHLEKSASHATLFLFHLKLRSGCHLLYLRDAHVPPWEPGISGLMPTKFHVPLECPVSVYHRPPLSTIVYRLRSEFSFMSAAHSALSPRS